MDQFSCKTILQTCFIYHVLAMASCHSLSILNHEIIGDPLDLSMFEFTKWHLNDQVSDESCVTVFPTRGKQTIEILKQYMFDSSLQRMSVIAKESEDASLKVCGKGSPEMLLSLCNKSTIPIDANEVLDNYTTDGARVLAIARKVLHKELTVESDLREKFPRNEIEKDLDFLGFIVFQNIVKPGSKATINTLQKANIRCVMATGDNLKTAAAVARQVDIIKEMQSTVKIKVQNGTVKFNVLTKSEKYSAVGDTVLKIDDPAWVFNQELYMRGLPYAIVLTGNTYKKLKSLNQSNILKNVLLSAGVFARMSPEDKVALIEDLKALDYGVGMCGDGANDCGALKAAHAGNVIKAKISKSSRALWSVYFLIHAGFEDLQTFCGKFSKTVFAGITDQNPMENLSIFAENSSQ